MCCFVSAGIGNDVDFFEAAVSNGERKGRTEMNKETQKAVAVATMELLDGRLLALIAILIFVNTDSTNMLAV